MIPVIIHIFPFAYITIFLIFVPVNFFKITLLSLNVFILFTPYFFLIFAYFILYPWVIIYRCIEIEWLPIVVFFSQYLIKLTVWLREQNIVVDKYIPSKNKPKYTYANEDAGEAGIPCLFHFRILYWLWFQMRSW